jgi:flagellar biosynthesis chaperone FliJ
LSRPRIARAARLLELRERARDEAALAVHAGEAAVARATAAIADAERAFTEAADEATSARLGTMGDFADQRARVRAAGRRVEAAKGALEAAKRALLELRRRAAEIAVDVRKAEAFRDAALRDAQRAASVVERKQTDEIAARTFERRRSARVSSGPGESAPSSRTRETP